MLLLTMISKGFMIEHFALFYPASPFFKPYQIITHFFMHGNFGHLLFNMYALWMFGAVLEQIWGPQTFLPVLYGHRTWCRCHAYGRSMDRSQFLVSTINEGGAAATMAVEKYRQLMGTPTVGASGAVYGILLAYGMLFPNNQLRLMFTPFALKAKYFVIIFAVIELVLGLIGGGNIAHFAHLGGMVFGFILVRFWKSKNRLYY